MAPPATPARPATPAGAFLMATALSLLFFGYESSRAASISLLAAKEVGLGSEALPFTVALGSPAGALILYLYATSIKKNGARYTLRVSNMACVGLLSLMTVFSSYTMRHGGLGGKCLVIIFYVFREIYISLLSTQHWSYLASVLDSSTTGYLVSSAGIVSISSAVGSCAVEWFVTLGGVWMLLAVAFICTSLSWTCAELAYAMGSGENRGGNATASARPERQRTTTVWKDSWELMLSHYTLKLLFLEAILHQSCSNMLNLMFHDGLRKGVAEDSPRAALVGRFFASVNIAACLLQTLVMPKILSHKTLPLFLKLIPIIVFCATALGFFDQSLFTMMLGFGILKVLEYSVMTSAMELIYMPMGHEVRYLGKELIRFFGHRLGKSGTSLLLSAASAHFQPSLQTQTIWSGTLAAAWGVSMYLLSTHLALKATLIQSHSNDAIAAASSSTTTAAAETSDKDKGEGQFMNISAPGLRRRKSRANQQGGLSKGDGDREDTTSEKESGGEEEEGDFDQTFYYSASSQSYEDLQNYERVAAVQRERAESLGNAGSNPSSPFTSGIGGGLRRRRRSNERSSSPTQQQTSSSSDAGTTTTLFDASVFDATGFYLSKNKGGSAVSISSWASQNSREDGEGRDDDHHHRPVGMVRVGSSHVSLNYLAALSRNDVTHSQLSDQSKRTRSGSDLGW